MKITVIEDLRKKGKISTVTMRMRQYIYKKPSGRGGENQSDGVTTEIHFADFLHPVRGFFITSPGSFLINILAHSHRYLRYFLKPLSVTSLKNCVQKVLTLVITVKN